MGAPYDTYDYPSYWTGRQYEHEAEVLAIRAFLEKIPKIRSILEIGSGFGRLVPTYSYRAKKVILTDPSARLLAIARKNHQGQKYNFVQNNAENLSGQVKAASVDLAICVRVFHHLKDVDAVIEEICRILKNKGFLILEFANKSHLKATISEFLKGNLTFPLDIFPSDKRSPKSLKAKTIPFFNYHPDEIKRKLKLCGFEVIETRSVSNIRSSLLKKHLSTQTLISLERILQRPLSYINFGPSIFLLAQKRPH